MSKRKKFKDTKFGKFAGQVLEDSPQETITESEPQVFNRVVFKKSKAEKLIPEFLVFYKIFKDGKVTKEEAPELIGAIIKIGIYIAALKGIEILI